MRNSNSFVCVHPFQHFEQHPSILPHFPPEIEVGSCSGYESQNASSETSFHFIKPRTLSSTGHYIRRPTNHYHPLANRNQELSHRQTFNNHVMNGQLSASCVRDSTSSSNESRYRQ